MLHLKCIPLATILILYKQVNNDASHFSVDMNAYQFLSVGGVTKLIIALQEQSNSPPTNIVHLISGNILFLTLLLTTINRTTTRQILELRIQTLIAQM